MRAQLVKTVKFRALYGWLIKFHQSKAAARNQHDGNLCDPRFGNRRLAAF